MKFSHCLYKFNLAILMFFIILLSSCTQESGDFGSSSSVGWSDYAPVLMKRIDLEKSIRFDSARTLQRPGKMFFRSNILYVSEKYQGVHVIDNTDPANPKNIGFLVVPGSIDIAMKRNIMYVDNSVDLVAIDITDIRNPIVSSRVPNTFPELQPPDGKTMDPSFAKDARPTETYIVDWIKKPVK